MKAAMSEAFIFKAKVQEEGNSLMWNFFVEVPDKISKVLMKGTDRRVICNFNNLIEVQIALTPAKGRPYQLILNKEVRKKLAVQPGDTIQVSIKKDESEYGIGIPDFFKEFCTQDPEGSMAFHKLTSGKQRTLLYLMNKPKSENKKLEKAWVIFEYLKEVKGNLDYKELNEAFKNSRFKI